jgi:hypothetical protein
VVQAATLARALVDADDAVVPSCEAEAAAAILRFGTDCSALMDFGEIERAAHAPDELALFFQEKQLPALADALRALVGRGSDQLLRVSQLSPEEMQAASSAVCSHIPCQANLIQEQLQRSFAAQFELAALVWKPHYLYMDFGIKYICAKTVQALTWLSFVEPILGTTEVSPQPLPAAYAATTCQQALRCSRHLARKTKPLIASHKSRVCVHRLRHPTPAYCHDILNLVPVITLAAPAFPRPLFSISHAPRCTWQHGSPLHLHARHRARNRSSPTSIKTAFHLHNRLQVAIKS